MLPHTLKEKLQELRVRRTPRILVISVSRQRLTLFRRGRKVREYPVSTAERGVGQRENSYQTPLGLHRIQEKIGEGKPLGALFKSREWTGEVWLPDSDLAREKACSDLITTRILWLEGAEPGFNSGTDEDGNLVDSYQRYIYIHGTNQEDLIGEPRSKGCIRMRNHAIEHVFDQVEVGDLVWIEE